jgi:very-short-patch-repair endonuclease
MSLAEVLLWQELRKRPSGLKFRRQHSVDPYIGDFYCAAAYLVIEVDGAAHDGAGAERDIGRDSFLESKGLKVLRVPASEILADPDGVSLWLAEQATNPLHPAAARRGPPPRERGGPRLLKEAQ